MEIVSLIIKIILCICSIFLIAVVLLQSGKGNVGAALGGMESVMGKSKARGRDALLAKLTKGTAIVFMVLAVAVVVIARYFS